MRQVHLRCPYCLTEGYVSFDSVKRFINHRNVKEPIDLPCDACAGRRLNQPLHRPGSRSRLWRWFDRVTRHSLIAKIIVAMTPVTLMVGVIGYKINLIENHPVTAFVIAILLFCEGMFLLGLLVDIPYDYSYDVVLNPAFKDLEANAWHKREIGQL